MRKFNPNSISAILAIPAVGYLQIRTDRMSARQPAPSSELFRYIQHADVEKFTAQGWELLPALDGTHHGEYSTLMRRRGEQD